MKAKNIIPLSIAPALRVTGSAGSAGVDVSAFAGDVKFTLDSSAGGGADNTLDVKVQHSDDNITFVDVPGAVFTQVTNAAPAFESIIVKGDGLKKFVRVLDIVLGTAPTFDRSVQMTGEKQYS